MRSCEFDSEILRLEPAVTTGTVSRHIHAIFLLKNNAEDLPPSFKTIIIAQEQQHYSRSSKTILFYFCIYTMTLMRQKIVFLHSYSCLRIVTVRKGTCKSFLVCLLMFLKCKKNIV